MKENMYAKDGHLDRLNDYYYVFSRNMRDLGTPVYSKNFFKAILEKFPQNSRIVVVYAQNHRPVAAAFLLMKGDTVEIPWASSIKEYNRYSPNMLLYWEVLRFSIRQRYKIFDFGRCSPDSGTYRFKKQWGAEEKQLYWYYILLQQDELPEINPNNPRYKLLIRTWQRMPLFLTKFLGPKIIRHIP